MATTPMFEKVKQVVDLQRSVALLESEFPVQPPCIHSLHTMLVSERSLLIEDISNMVARGPAPCVHAPGTCTLNPKPKNKYKFYIPLLDILIRKENAEIDSKVFDSILYSYQDMINYDDEFVELPASSNNVVEVHVDTFRMQLHDLERTKILRYSTDSTVIKAALNAELTLCAILVDDAARLLKDTAMTKLPWSKGTFTNSSVFACYEDPQRDHVKIVTTNINNSRVAIIPFYETPEHRVKKIMSYAVMHPGYLVRYWCSRK